MPRQKKTKRLFRKCDCKYCAYSVCKALNRYLRLVCPFIDYHLGEVEFFVEYAVSVSGEEMYGIILSYNMDWLPTNEFIKAVRAEMHYHLCKLATISEELQMAELI